MLPSAAELVARFLKANGYTETLNAFIKEAGLAPDVGASTSDQVTIEQILQEKKTFDLSLNFEKLGVDTERRWLTPAPSKPQILESFPRSNILCVTLLQLILPSVLEPKPYLAATTADRRLHLIDPCSPSFPLIRSYSSFQDSPILDLLVIGHKYLLMASMSGRLLLYDTATDQVLDQAKNHSKYLVKLVSWSDSDSTIIASAGWDAKIFFYRLKTADNQPIRLGEPIATVTLSRIPETLLFIQHPDTLRPILVVTQRDSTFLYYYSVPLPGASISESCLLGRQNLAPHSNAWIAFTPSDVQLCPSDTTLVAVATSSTPHMKLLVVRLIVPYNGTESPGGPDSAPITQASQARADLIIQDREEAAIILNISTMAPQTVYSTPRLVWRPDGSGIYVSSDDGIVRGFDISGKQRSSLEAHEPGSKLRCLWSGVTHSGSQNDIGAPHKTEILVSGGFDQRLILWSSD